MSYFLIIFPVFYVALSILQCLAIYAWFHDGGLGLFGSVIASIIIAPIPIIGQLIGTFGAIDVWKWELFEVIIVFWGGLFVAPVLFYFRYLKQSSIYHMIVNKLFSFVPKLIIAAKCVAFLLMVLTISFCVYTYLEKRSNNITSPIQPEYVLDQPSPSNLKPYTEEVIPSTDLETQHLAQITAKHPDVFTLLPAVEKWIAAQPAKEKARNTYVLESGTAHEVVELFNIYKQATRGATAPISSGMVVHPEKNESVSKKSQSKISRYEYTKTSDSYADQSPTNVSSTKHITSPIKVFKFDELPSGQKASIELSCFEEKVKGRIFFEECINNRLLAK